MKLREQYPNNGEEAEILEQRNAAPVPAELLVIPNDPAEVGAILFGQLAAMWERDCVERVVGGKTLVAASTKQKYRNHLHNHILPRWAGTPIGRFRANEVLDWLQQESGSWYMMTDLRNIMSGIFTKAQEWEVLPDTFANPITRVKLPKKWQVYERRTKRQLWAYSGLAIEAHSSGEYRYVDGQLRRSQKPAALRGLNKNHNHDLKSIFKSAAMQASGSTGLLHKYYEGLLAKGMKPALARLTVARKMATITWIVWKKGVRFDAEHLKLQAA